MTLRLQPIALECRGIRLEPLAPEHHDALAAAAADGELWRLWYTSVPAPEETRSYIDAALAGQRAGHMLPWAVRELESGDVIGTTRYHDIVAAIDRVEIGYTWYARRWQRSHVNTVCKLLLLEHAFDGLGCQVVGLRTDGFNFASQRAIEALGAKKDGVIRHHAARRDGTVRDSVLYSILASEWRDVKRHLELRLARHQGRSHASSGGGSHERARAVLEGAGAALHVRLATPTDAPAISELIAQSARGLARADYSEAQIEAALGSAWGLDNQLIDDGTYFVVEDDERMVACGGWSFRRTLFGGDGQAGREPDRLDVERDAAKIRAFFVHPEWARRGIGTLLLKRCEDAARTHGFQRAELMATLPGERLYRTFGYVAGPPVATPLPGGLAIEFVPMAKDLAR